MITIKCIECTFHSICTLKKKKYWNELICNGWRNQQNLLGVKKYILKLLFTLHLHFIHNIYIPVFKFLKKKSNCCGPYNQYYIAECTLMLLFYITINVLQVWQLLNPFHNFYFITKYLHSCTLYLGFLEVNQSYTGVIIIQWFVYYRLYINI